MSLSRLLPCLAALILAVLPWPVRAEDDAALADLIERFASRDPSRTREETLPDGSRSIDLGGDFQQVVLAQNRGGELVAACVGGIGEAGAFLGRELRTGKALPLYQPPADPEKVEAARRHGMSVAEFERITQMIASAPVLAPEAANIVIQNNDGAGEGFNDPTAVAPEGGNSGTTRGAQRLNVFNFAAGIWGAFLDSSVTTTVRAQFDPLTPCSPSGGVLGSAGPLNIHANFTNAALANTFYPAALANKQRGADLNANPEISSTFNSDVDLGCLGAGTRFYYGLDNATPANRINLLVVVLHELGHGLGSLTFTDSSTGAFLGGLPDVWAHFLFDRSVNLLWLNMTNAQRVTSSVNTNNLLWDGPSVRIASGFLTAGREVSTGRVEMFTPNPLQPGSSVSHWNTTATPNLLMEPAINVGLPLTLDLTRQQMRDIGWYRDSNTDLTPDTITSVLPSGGSVSIGSNVNITWTNNGGFNRNVTIELSTNGGTTFPTVIASDVANTGSRSWTVPNTPTTQARIRVREHDFVVPAGVSAANFTIGSGNTPPTFTPAAAITRQQGSPPGTAVTVGTVSDAETAAGSLTVTQIAGGTATGITVSNIANSNGTVTAQVSASCTATSGTVRFQVSDGSLTGTGDLSVNVTANSAPTLSYNNASINGGSNGTVNPATGPADNGSIASTTLFSQGTYTGGISVGATNGVVSLTGAAPIGGHTITVRATDNCGATTNASFTLTVNNTPPTFTPAAAITRQQGSPAGAAVTVGTVADAQTAAGSLTVTQIAGGTATGITVSNIANSNGTVSAQVSASCTATSGTVRFQVSDGSLTGTGDLSVNVTANSAPTLGSYPNTAVAVGGSTNVTPGAAPSDNGSVTGLNATAAGFTGTLTPTLATGVIAVGNAGPGGVYTVNLTATDNCGATTPGSFTLTVGDALFRDGFEGP